MPRRLYLHAELVEAREAVVQRVRDTELQRFTMTALTFGHVGVGVADIDAACDWYSTVFGFKVLRPPFETAATGGPSGAQAHDVLGADFRRMRQAFLVSGDGVGIELFQLIDPQHQRRE